MKVLMIGNSPSVHGGIASVINQIKNHNWLEEGIKLEFIPTYKGGNTLYKVSYFLFAFIKIFLKCMFDRPDVVYMHMSFRGSFYRKNVIHKLCCILKVPDVIHLHGSEFKKWFDESKRKTQKNICKLLRECNTVIVLGEKWNSTIKEIEPLTNTAVINNTVCVPNETVQWNENRFQVLFMGVLVQRKGVIDLIESINKLKIDRHISNMYFVIAGAGKEKECLEKKVYECGLENYVEFVGWIEDKKKEELFKESQILILPSYNEGLPIAILEAISYGMPVIATNVGDVSAAVSDGQNGYLLYPGDISGMADKLVRLNDYKVFQRMSNSSKELAKEKFSDEVYFQKLKKIFEKNNY